MANTTKQALEQSLKKLMQVKALDLSLIHIFHGLGVQGQKGLRPLRNMEKPPLQKHLVCVEGGKLGTFQAGGIEHMEHGPIPPGGKDVYKRQSKCCWWSFSNNLSKGALP